MDEKQHAYCKQLYPLVERQLATLQILALNPQKFQEVREITGGCPKQAKIPDLYKTLVPLVNKELVEKRNLRPDSKRALFAYRITPMGLAYLEFITPQAAPSNPKLLTEEDFAFVTLVPQELRILRLLSTFEPGVWNKTEAVGGSNKTNHAHHLARLAQKKLIDRVVWGNNLKPTYRCRINDNGIRYLEFLDRKEH